MQNRVSFVGDKNVLELGGGDRVVTASQPCERSKEHRIKKSGFYVNYISINTIRLVFSQGAGVTWDHLWDIIG